MCWQSFAIIIPLLAAMPAVANDRVTLTVSVTGVTPNKGEVVASIFDEKKKWLKKPLLEGRREVRGGDSVDIVFTDLATGEYAVSIYYDLDDDGEMDTGLFGIPSEPVGFSNNARGKFGPAKWKHAMFLLEEDMTHPIQVVNAID